MSGDVIAVEGASLRIWRETVSWDGRRTAALGGFEATTTEAAVELLTEAARVLAAEGFEALVGPMDGDTWASYRLVIESNGRAPFLMEPPERPELAAAFARAGWDEIAHYGSAEGPLPEAAPVPEPPPGISLRPFDPARADDELTAMHRVSVEAFSRAFLYRPIALERFLGMYRPVVAHIDPRLVILAEDQQGDLQGYLFAVPDLADPSPDRAVIVKTYASLQPGLGSSMMRRFNPAAAAAGFRRAIHALMHEDNLSARHSTALGATVFRRYALWGLRL